MQQVDATINVQSVIIVLEYQTVRLHLAGTTKVYWKRLNHHVPQGNLTTIKVDKVRLRANDVKKVFMPMKLVRHVPRVQRARKIMLKVVLVILNLRATALLLLNPYVRRTAYLRARWTKIAVNLIAQNVIKENIQKLVPEIAKFAEKEDFQFQKVLLLVQFVQRDFIPQLIC